MKRRRRTQANPMRLLIMLAIMWAAGSLLFAAEKLAPGHTSEPTQVRAAALQADGAPAAAAKAAGQAASEEPQAASETAPETTPETAPETSQDAPEAQARKDRANDEEEDTERETTRSTKPESAADAGASPRRFVPSEQVRADFDVSFPIDI